MFSPRGGHYSRSAATPPHERQPPPTAIMAAPATALATPRHPLPPIPQSVREECQIQMHNGRKYASFRRARYYMFPCDRVENDRLDIFHHIMGEIRGTALHSDNIQLYQRQNLLTLDIGSGSGIWVIRMGDTYHSGQSIGVDLHLFQEARIPPNVSFALMDVEAPWREIDDKMFDLIHARLMLGSIHSWPSLYLKIFSNLKPHIGFLEQIEIDWMPRVDGGPTPPSNSRLRLWYDQLMRAMDDAGRTMRFDGAKVKDQLHNVGFVDISEQVIRLPLNPWPNNEPERHLSRWVNLFLMSSLESLALLPLTKYLNWSQEQVLDLCSTAKKESQDIDHHWYMRVHIFNARRP